jgi:hypothetical protein
MVSGFFIQYRPAIVRKILIPLLPVLGFGMLDTPISLGEGAGG